MNNNRNKPTKTNYHNSANKKKSPSSIENLNTHSQVNNIHNILTRPKSPKNTLTNPDNIKLETHELIITEDRQHNPLKSKGYLHGNALQNYHDDQNNKKKYSNIHLKPKDKRESTLKGFINKPDPGERGSIRTQKNNLIHALENISKELKPNVKNTKSKTEKINFHLNKNDSPNLENSTGKQGVKQKIAIESIMADFNKNQNSEMDETYDIKSSLNYQNVISKLFYKFK